MFASDLNFNIVELFNKVSTTEVSLVHVGIVALGIWTAVAIMRMVTRKGTSALGSILSTGFQALTTAQIVRPFLGSVIMLAGLGMTGFSVGELFEQPPTLSPNRMSELKGLAADKEEFVYFVSQEETRIEELKQGHAPMLPTPVNVSLLLVGIGMGVVGCTFTCRNLKRLTEKSTV